MLVEKGVNGEFRIKQGGRTLSDIRSSLVLVYYVTRLNSPAVRLLRLRMASVFTQHRIVLIQDTKSKCVSSRSTADNQGDTLYSPLQTLLIKPSISNDDLLGL